MNASSPPIDPEPENSSGDLSASHKRGERMAFASPAQHAVWFMDQQDSGTACNISVDLALKGLPDIEVLRHSWNAIVQRHEILRTAFLYLERGRRVGQVLQVIAQEMPVEFPVVDLRGAAPSERDLEIRKRPAQTFDITRLPLFRTRLLRLSDSDYILQFDAHRIITDEAGVELLLQDLSNVYSARIAGGALQPRTGDQYSGFADRQSHSFPAEMLDRQLSHWAQKLAGVLPVLELPCDCPRAAAGSYLGLYEVVRVPAGLIQRLRSHAEWTGANLPVLFLSAFAALLQRYSGVDELVLGSGINNRRIAEHRTLVGPVDNVLALRIDVSGDPVCIDLVDRVRQVVETAYANRELPFEKVLLTTRAGQSQPTSLPYQVRFDLDAREPAEVRFAGLDVGSLSIAGMPSRCDVWMSWFEDADETQIRARYNAGLFAQATIARLLEHFRTLLEGIADDPSRRISGLPLLTDDERRRLLVEWNDTAITLPRDACIHELFEEQAERRPDHVAVVSLSGQLKYGELNERANQLAHYLRRYNIGPDVRVGISMERGLEMMVGLLGIMKSGAAYVPLDPALPSERLAFMMEDAQLAALITKESVQEHLGQVTVPTICLDRDRSMIERESRSNPRVPVASENLAYMIYTSGSTGRPKGVQLPHSAVVNFLRHMQRNQDAATGDGQETAGAASRPFTLAMGPADIHLGVANMSFDASVLDFYVPLTIGASLVVLPSETLRDPAGLAEKIKTLGVTVMHATPSTYRMLLDVGWGGDPQLKLYAGGEALPWEIAEQLLHRCSSLWNLYGPTETAVYSCIHRVIPDDHTVYVGRPISNTQVYILDAHMQPVPCGVTGELCIGGDGVARGYWKRPELTTERFVNNPFRTGTRLYKTGDLARYRIDGKIEYLGRMDNQVKVRGFRIELGEIEVVLAQHPAVRECVVVAREDAGENKRLVAYCIPDPRASALTGDLRAYLKERLPDYMVPSAFVMLDAFPLTPNRKVDRRALPAPQPDRPDIAPAFVPARNPVELHLTKLWEEVLKIHPIGMRDSFFELGAESLQAAHLFALVSKKFGKNVSPSTLFEAPTIEQQAQLLGRQEKNVQWSSLVPVQPLGSRPPVFCVHGGAGTVLFFHDVARYIGQDQPLYALQAQGLYDVNPPHTTIGQMADHYIKEIRTIQPEGPYYLVGYCSGAVIVFEMAHRLEQEGQTLALLASINGTSPTYRVNPSAEGMRSSSSSFTPRTAFQAHREALRRLDLRQRCSYVLAALIDSARGFAIYCDHASGLLEFRRRLRKMQINYYRSRQRHRPLPARIRDTFFRFNSFYAEREYRPKPYHGRMVIFRAKGLYHDPLLGWEGLVTGGIEVHEVPGVHTDHRNIVEEPAVRILARQVSESLHEAQSASRSQTEQLIAKGAN